MARQRRKFRRPQAKRPYRKLFVISTEGRKTERQYFNLLNRLQPEKIVKTLPCQQNNSPAHVLKRMRQYIRDENLLPSDEAWLVVDRDHWPVRQLDKLNRWAKEKSNYGLAVSNPSFEYWLLLHFEKGDGITSLKKCLDRLQKYLSDYDKGIDQNKFTEKNIVAAIRRAKLRDSPSCRGWPRDSGITTIYKLVESIMGR